MRCRPAARGRTRHPVTLVAQRGRAAARHRPAAVRKFARQQQLRFERARAGATAGATAAMAGGDDPPIPGAPYAAFPWRPTSSGTRRRGDLYVLNEIPSARASSEFRIRAPSQPLCARFLEDPTVGSAISPLRRNLVSRGQLRQLVSPPPQLRLACYQFRCEAGITLLLPLQFRFIVSLFDWLNSTPKLVVRIRNFQLVKFHF
ncbi:pollen-specific leucine-rich repeat extensin-like protein 3 [Iris pallida]|uniref:Pollen-specific leucine-rich repeat extensin-like protein 3 n=1 Tax=Iris pallida TaxID=29817 RepID=A0AAX6HN44_IRIPA|nr:pollen-specific leucine-rich repeat extensin-like protein 3 [Iris pallida]